MTTQTVTDWGLALQIARKKKRMDQTSAAKALGVTRPYLSSLENSNSDPSRELIDKAAALYELKSSELAALGE